MSVSDPRDPNWPLQQDPSQGGASGAGGGFADVSRSVNPDDDLYDFQDSDPNAPVELADRVVSAPNPEPDLYSLQDSGEMPAPKFAEGVDDEDLYEFKDDDRSDELVFNDDYVHKPNKDIYDLRGGGEAPAFVDKASQQGTDRYQTLPQALEEVEDPQFAVDAGSSAADGMSEWPDEASGLAARPPASVAPPEQRAPRPTGRHQSLPPSAGPVGPRGTGRHVAPFAQPSPGAPPGPPPLAPPGRGTGRHQALGPRRGAGETGSFGPPQLPPAPAPAPPVARSPAPPMPGRPIHAGPRPPMPPQPVAGPPLMPPTAGPVRQTRRIQGLGPPVPVAGPPAQAQPAPAPHAAPMHPARPASPPTGSPPMRRPPQARSPVAPASEAAPRVPPAGMRRATSSYNPKHVERPRASSDDEDPPFLKK